MNKFKREKDKNIENNMKLKKKTNLKELKKSAKGITLIALVVTIVVLLILAGVTISMLTGENGIINQAKNAKEESLKSELEELVDLTLTEYKTDKAVGKDTDLGELLNSKVGKDFDAVTEEENCYIVEKNGYEVKVSKDGDRLTDAEKVGGVRPQLEISKIYDEGTDKVTITVKITNKSELGTIDSFKLFDSGNQEIVEKTSEEDKKTFEVDKNGTYKAEVKATTDGIQKVSTITVKVDNWEMFSDIYTATKKYTDSEGNTAWIPQGFAVGVSDSINKISKGLVITDKVDAGHNSIGNEFVWVPAEVSEMAKQVTGTDVNGNQNYQGKLYNFTATSATEMTNYGQGTSSFREPDIVSTYDNNSSYLNIIKNILTKQTDKYADMTTFNKTMQGDYNAMIKSVGEYGGFYVSRYEMSKSSNNTAASVGNVTPLVNDGSNMWYGLYAYGKTYTNSANSVESSMIWGSQYDAMMRWMQSGEQGVDVTGNIGNNKNTSTITKKSTTDRIKNVYDLYGCYYEWTLEAYSFFYRVLRGGIYNSSDSPSVRYENLSNDSYSFCSSRLTLYVK